MDKFLTYIYTKHDGNRGNLCSQSTKGMLLNHWMYYDTRKPQREINLVTFISTCVILLCGCSFNSVVLLVWYSLEGCHLCWRWRSDGIVNCFCPFLEHCWTSRSPEIAVGICKWSVSSDIISMCISCQTWLINRSHSRGIYRRWCLSNGPLLVPFC